MLEYLSYILFFGVIIIVFSFIYIRLKFGFWSIQPVFHVYDLGFMLNPPGIICSSLPKRNKYTNFNNIKTIIFSELSSLRIQRFVNLIKINYLQNNENTFSPELQNVVPYLGGHNSPSFVSFYNEDYYVADLKKGTTATDEKIIGAMTSRPIHIAINNGNKDANFSAYYVDYLCVDKSHRKKGIAQQLIQTHHYNHRYINKKIVVSLFKREDELTGIVPLCVYTTYGFPVTTWTKPQELSGEYKLLEINAQNFHFLWNFIKECDSKFDITIKTELTNIIELIKTKNIFIYVTIVDDIIISAYFFRKTCVQVEKNMEVLSCFASISNTDDDIFIQGFKICFWKISAENNFGFSSIEDVSDNDIIINNILQKTTAMIVSPTAYFFYNFAYTTFKSKKVLIIN